MLESAVIHMDTPDLKGKELCLRQTFQFYGILTSKTWQSIATKYLSLTSNLVSKTGQWLVGYTSLKQDSPTKSNRVKLLKKNPLEWFKSYQQFFYPSKVNFLKTTSSESFLPRIDLFLCIFAACWIISFHNKPLTNLHVWPLLQWKRSVQNGSCIFFLKFCQIYWTSC